jgi:hypothetical protein
MIIAGILDNLAQDTFCDLPIITNAVDKRHETVLASPTGFPFQIWKIDYALLDALRRNVSVLAASATCARA